MDWVKKSIQFNEKCSMSEKLIDFGEVTPLTWVTVNYLAFKNIVKQRERQYNWEAVLLRNKENWICENLLKINLTSLKFNKNCIHLCLFLVLYTSYMRTMMQIKIQYTIDKCIFETNSRLCIFVWDFFETYKSLG